MNTLSKNQTEHCDKKGYLIAGFSMFFPWVRNNQSGKKSSED